jgi:hypothetical protein
LLPGVDCWLIAVEAEKANEDNTAKIAVNPANDDGRDFFFVGIWLVLHGKFTNPRRGVGVWGTPSV